MKIIYLIVGLGNPGKKYEHTRHNVGFDFVDEFANKLGIDIDKDGFKGKYALCKYFDKDIILLKPQTFMNNSGESIIEIVNYFKIDIDNILVVHDFIGEEGMKKMNEIMNKLRYKDLNDLSSLFKEEVTLKEDYLLSKTIDLNKTEEDIFLPKSDVLIIHLKNNNTRFMIRPSGTEPKLKCYIEVKGKDEIEANKLLSKYQELFNLIVGE